MDEIFSNPIYLGIALSVLGLAGGAFFSWVFTFFYFKKSQSRKLLCHTTRNTDYLGYRRADFHNLSVHYGDRQLTNPVQYTLYLWNCGNITINGSDISQVDPLAYGRNDIEIIETAPIWTTRESINAKILTSSDKTKIFVEFDFLDSNDGIAIQFLADRPGQERPRPNRLEAYGTIKGLNRAPFHVTAGFERGAWWQRYLALAAIAFFGISAAAIAYDAWLSGLDFTSIAKILAAIIFGLIAIAASSALFENLGDASLVIPGLLRKPREESDDDRGAPPDELIQLLERTIR